MKKKKGFTLIELIAVIAILGILAAVLVPNIIGYSDKAKDARKINDAKVVVNAVDAWNAEAKGEDVISDKDRISSSTKNLVGEGKLLKEYPQSLKDAGDVGALRKLATGAKEEEKKIASSAKTPGGRPNGVEKWHV